MHYILIAAFFITVCSAFLLKIAAPFLALVDKPDSRKQHQGEIPAVGGLAMFISICFSLIFLPVSFPALSVFISCIATLVLCGVIDDRFALSPRSRLIVQILVVLGMIYFADLTVFDLGKLFDAEPLTLNHLSAWLFTVFSVVGVINAINMIDGIDGLAGGIALSAFLWLAAVAFFAGMLPEANILLLLAVVTLAFLTFNLRHPWRKKAAIFMGDAGSTMLGFALAWFAIEITQHSTGAPVANKVPPITVVWIIGLPIIDAVVVMLSRLLNGKSPFAPGRDHIYHLLLKMGMSDAWVTFLLMTFSSCFGLIGVLGWLYHIPDCYLFYGFIILSVLYRFIYKWLRYKTENWVNNLAFE